MKSKALKENKDFRRLYYRGESRAGAYLVSYVIKSRRGNTRIGITGSKKIGGAVRRNRAKRVIRAAFFELEPRLSGDWDIVFVARSRTACVKMQVVRDQMEAQLTEMGVLD